ncbi:DUF11 domain-containing protein [Nocardiopsis kunsanensis]|uniref:DUF11 domain-containing protein n=1 Tax=Nocardiopsis kunsanensis TaxID=141693 RepID=A0A918XDS1_9ACTN|nr:DUF11 domain-containing protein [Nocardiopsis kunsanensis]GHD27334.1 hypothetical protein GCM10007147_26360 [Nocardiopsis kunsanensis]
MARIAQKNWNPVAGWVGVGATGLLISASGPVAAAPDGHEGPDGGGSPPVGVSIDGVDGPVGPGEEVTFDLTVDNSGDRPVDQALLAQHVPDGMELVSAGDEGVIEQNIANWVVELPPGESAEYTVTARLDGGTRPGRQLGSTACLLLERETEPAACATENLAVVEEGRGADLAGAAGGEHLLRVAGAGLVALFVWMLWRRRGVLLGR